MAGIVLVGAQWGDEGKGKITDLLADDMDYVVRFQGGNNAGHTDHPRRAHAQAASDPERDHVSAHHAGHRQRRRHRPEGAARGDRPARGRRPLDAPAAHLLQRAPDHAVPPRPRRRVASAGSAATRSARRGAASARRTWTRPRAWACASRTSPTSTSSARSSRPRSSRRTTSSTKVYGLPTYTVDEIAEEYIAYAERIKPHIADTSHVINTRARAPTSGCFFEGAQGTLLDLDHGTYPFVTSSSPTAGGACTGTGVGPEAIDRVLGIAKAYITRVGSGPFPTELDSRPGSIGEHLTTKGGEFGTTTGRQRRCGWYDGVIVRYAVQVNGLTDLVITKLDVLSELDTIKVCVAYEYEGHRYNELPCHQTVFHHAKPIYEELPGWKSDITACRTFEELPKKARDYIDVHRGPRRGPGLDHRGRARAASRRSCAGGSRERKTGRCDNAVVTVWRRVGGSRRRGVILFGAVRAIECSRYGSRRPRGAEPG